MDQQRDSMVFYVSFYDAINTLPDDEQLKMFHAILSYGLKGEHRELSGAASGMFSLIKPQIDANIRRRENGKKGGAQVGNSNAKKQPKNNQETTKGQPKNKQKQPNVNVNANVNANVNNIPPLSPKGGECAQRFAQFYSAYPKKKSKQQAQKAFAKLNPDAPLLEDMLTALEKQKRSDEWQRNNGQYIPYPASWINDRRWEDDTAQIDLSQKPKKTYTPEELETIERLRRQ